MPVTYSIDANRRMIRTACTRPLTFAQVIDHFRELGETPPVSVIWTYCSTSAMPIWCRKAANWRP